MRDVTRDHSELNMLNDKQEKMRKLPGVDGFLQSPEVKVLIDLYGRALVGKVADQDIC